MKLRLSLLTLAAAAIGIGLATAGFSSTKAIATTSSVLTAPRLAVPTTCEGLFIDPPEEEDEYLYCRPECTEGCQITVVIGPTKSYAYCHCEGLSEDPCCHTTHLLTSEPTSAAAEGDCASQSSSCPTGSTCTLKGDFVTTPHGTTFYYWAECI